MNTSTRNFNREKQRVKIYTTDGWEIQGDVSIPTGGYNARLSDFLNSEHTFIALTNALVYGLDGTLLATESFISVNKQAVKLVIEDQVGREEGEEEEGGRRQEAGGRRQKSEVRLRRELST